MPVYNVKDKTTGEVTEHFLKWEDLQKMLGENPNLETVISAPQIVSGRGSVVDAAGRLPEGFKDKLREIKKKHPGANGVDHLI